MNSFVYHEVRTATHLSEKCFVLQTLIILQHRNQLNFVQLWRQRGSAQ